MTAIFSVTTECPILFGIFEGFSWIRCEGKGSFLNSPALKDFGINRISSGEVCLVIDLQACTGMDSTFMGTLAGLAARLSVRDGGVIQVADAGPRNRRSLEDLGLDFLMEIEPPEPVWHPKLETVRAGLKPLQPIALPGQVQQTLHVLEAHKILSETNEKNTKVFANVVNLLEAELAEKQKRTDLTKDK